MGQAYAKGLAPEALLPLAEELGDLGAWYWDLETDVLECSQGWLRIHGAPRSPQNREELFALAHPDDHDRVEESIARAADAREPVHTNLRIVRANDGAIRYVRVLLNPLRNDDGKLTALRGMVQDVTDLRTAQAGQMATQARLDRVIAGSADGLWEWESPEGGTMWWSDRFYELLGYEPNAFVPTLETFFEMMHPDDVPDRSADVEPLSSSPAKFETEYRLRTKVGRYRWFQARGQNFFHADGTAAQMSGTVRDITESKQRALDLEARELQLRTIAAHVPGMVYQFEIDAKGEWSFPYLSEGARDLFGIDPADEEAGDQLFARVHPEDQAKVADAVQASAETLEPYHVKHRVVRPDGVTKWLSATSKPFRGNDGSTRWIGLALDITDHVGLEERLRQVYKMEAIGTLAGGIAHDFNNILSSVLGYGELALEDARMIDGTVDLQDSLEEIVKAALRAKDIVSQILSFSRRHPTQQRPLQLRPLLEDTMALMRRSIPAGIDVQAHIEPDCPLVFADADQMRQVLVNLCTNAYQAMAPQVRATRGPDRTHRMTLRLQSGPLPAALEARQELPPGRYVEMSVGDTGPGVPSDVLDKIFEPYFTTRQDTGHSGLGLATVQGIVSAHSGSILVDNVPGEGMRFRIFLPVHVAAPAPRPVSKPAPAPAPTGHRVMFVDDDQQIRDIVRRSLERLGYATEVFDGGSAAFRRFSEVPDAYDVVVTDLSMPEMAGTELAQRLLTVRPDLPIILCTGFGDDGTKQEALDIGVRSFVSKPISARNLAEVIGSVLSSP